MEAIEIYQKINAITENEDTAETMVALDFVRRKVENKHYAKQGQEKTLAYAGGLIGQACISPAMAQQDPVATLRNFVRDEIKAANTDEAKTAEKAA